MNNKLTDNYLVDGTLDNERTCVVLLGCAFLLYFKICLMEDQLDVLLKLKPKKMKIIQM